MSPSSRIDRFFGFWAAWSVALLLILVCEGLRWANPETRTVALTGWLCGPEADWLPFFPIFLLALVIWNGERRPVPQLWTLERRPPDHSGLKNRLIDSLLSLWLAVLAIGVTAWSGWDMQNLPPAYHDEFSYLLQSLTFLDGRTWFPSFEPLPQLFDQMHVLNEGRFASRYFPGAGVWFATFHGVGSILGVWIAQGIVTLCASVVAGELAGRSARVVAGLAVVFSPGLCLFSQLYLAHMPTLVGLSVFLVFMLRLYRLCEHESHTGSVSTNRTRFEVGLASAMAGIGLSYAMLCRPMTAAGVGLPFGLWFFAWIARSLLRSKNTTVSAALPLSPSPFLPLTLMALPLVAGIGIQLAYNHSITGSALVSPYQLYTDIYTPRHGYGFHNVQRAELHLGPKVLDHYDRWAEDLTLPLALRKMGIRIVASSRWTLGLVPMVFVVVWLIWNWQRWPGELKLVVASIVSLHAVHLPYWFEGIMGWHYVFESALLWAIVLGVMTVDFARQCRSSGHEGLRWWWGGVLFMSLATTWFTVSPLWPGRLPTGLAEIRYPRKKYAHFAELLQQQVTTPAIVFIRPDPSDRHIDYVYNTPDLTSPILRARAPASDSELQRAVALFPQRTPWLFDAASGQLLPILLPTQPVP